MAGYRRGSRWSDLNELQCLLAYKQLEEVKFPRNKLTELAKEIANHAGLTVNSVKAKIGNYKSVAGINSHSNASQNTKSMYSKYGHLPSIKLRELVNSGKYL